MKTIPLTALAAIGLFAAIVAPAAAQSYGDTQLSYSNGVVYDDDLVPGRGLNQPFLVGEEPARATRSYSSGRRQPSANLIGADGRVDRSLMLDANRAQDRYGYSRPTTDR
ncbi:hypothetical protein L1787_21040 [Acuticoccus sp. M5D2P5]|uniref:hypothetical protein n=1 Tax=Acuticoccus kalidii TaxID=2910977 RepID=UPI001F322ED5|nr:hypothetical protein [Acuticoccus kalidii]MCF3935879.1 hypothetical protein [Acuticoccus kalidii]